LHNFSSQSGQPRKLQNSTSLVVVIFHELKPKFKKVTTLQSIYV